MAANCSERHFIVIKVDFDVRREMIFQDVRVYDSLRRTGRHNEAVNKNSIGANFLRQLQVFLSQFAFYGAPGNDKLINNDPDLILADAAYTCCPVQHNMQHDCALFAFATLLHLVWDEEVTGDTFSQAHFFREDLHAVLSLAQMDEMSFPDPKQFLSSKVLRSFFPRLENKEYGGGGAEGTSLADDTSTDYVRILSQCRDTNLSSLTDGETRRDRCSAKRRSRPPLQITRKNDDDSDDDSDSEFIDEMDGESTIDEMPDRESTHEGENETNASRADDHDRTEDKIFEKFFTGTDITFYSLRDIDFAIDRYEQTSGYRILIRRSAAFARTYQCGSHYSCCFRAKFGKMRNEPYIVLKTKNSVLLHCGPPLPPRAKGGHAYKKRIKGRLDSSVDNVCTVKADTPVPRDIMKAAANLDGLTTTYNQSFRAMISGSKIKNYKNDVREFQLIIPYQQKFQALNPGSTTDYERDAENHIGRLFICPGIMKTSLRFVRPVMSLDACHLKSQWKGTLYTASVKTGCNELYPVALAIMNGNENDEGWTWFLSHLHSSIELLVMDHPLRRVTYKYFTFISDRQKGLINALERVFPMNHSCFCHVHIRRNADANVGKKVGDCVYSLATTFSTRVAEYLLAKIESISNKGKEYLEAIPPSQWRNTAWMNDPGLPPRFGIGSTNMSESTNSMLEHSRDVNWLQCIDTILAKMVQRISTLRSTKYVGKTGIVDHVEGLLTKLWDDCAGYRVVEIEEGGYRYTLYRWSDSRRVATTGNIQSF